MDLELEEIFEWQNPFCTLLTDIGSIDPEDGIDSMLDQIELPEIEDDALAMIPGDAVASSTNLSSSATFVESTEEPVSSPLWPCDLHAPVVNSSSLQLPLVQGSGKNPPAASSIDPVGSPQSSSAPLKGASSVTASQDSHEEAPVTPPAAKPKRTRATKAKSKKSAPKVKKQCRRAAARAEKPEEGRLANQAEHIMRERQRRDDMASKYLILESLLPPGPKRERAVVVETAISFVSDLQQKRDELLKRRAHLKLMAPSQSLRQVQSKKVTSLHDSSRAVTAPCKELHSGENCGTDSPIISPIMAQEESPTTTNPATMALIYPSGGSAQDLLQVHVHFSEEEIVIDLVCHRPRRQNFQSFLLQAVDSFGLDITRCSINRVPHGFVQCTITCTKSQELNPSLTESEIQTSATLIGALRSVLSQC